MDHTMLVALFDTLMNSPLTMEELMDTYTLFPKERKCYRSI